MVHVKTSSVNNLFKLNYFRFAFYKTNNIITVHSQGENIGRTSNRIIINERAIVNVKSLKANILISELFVFICLMGNIESTMLLQILTVKKQISKLKDRNIF